MSLDDIRAREQAATEGPWVWSPNTWTVADSPPFDLHRFDTMSQTICRVDESMTDGDFIAHARTDIPFLLDERDKLRAALDAVLAEHKPIHAADGGDEEGCQACDWEQEPEYPCATVRAITEALR